MIKLGFFGLSASLAALGTAALMAVPPDPVAAEPQPVYQWNPLHTCTFCHDAHGGPNTANLHNEDVEVLCLTCHGPGGVSTLKADTHEGETCVVCHDKHKDMDNWLAGENLKLVGKEHLPTGLARITTPNGNLRDVVFESLGTDAGQPALHSFADNDMDGNGVFDGVCEVCHIEEGVDNHNFGRTCTACHLHEDEFKKP